MDFFRQIQLITEAWAIEHNVPVKRKFTAAELEQPIEQVREAAELLKEDSFRAIRQANAEREGK
jgi:hypothetical protein